jgi:hypothetical protein
LFFLFCGEAGLPWSVGDIGLPERREGKSIQYHQMQRDLVCQ